VRARGSCDRAVGDEAVPAVVFKEVAYDDEQLARSLLGKSHFLPGGVECPEDVGACLMRIERRGPGGELLARLWSARQLLYQY
jgi:hypothetical protein